MRCPCDKSNITPTDFRSWLCESGNREALLAAKSVVKSDAFGLVPMEGRIADGRPVLSIGDSPPATRPSVLRRLLRIVRRDS